jgi:endoglucanase
MHVARTLEHELEANGVPHFRDPIGNIVVGAASKADYLRLLRERTDEPLRVFIAHMDHPGFHGAEWLSPTRLSVKWHGGSPTKFLEGAPVWLADEEGWVAEGHLREAKMIPSGRAIESGVVEVPLADRRDDRRIADLDARSLFGGFRFRAAQWEEGRLLYTKAADDLVGSYAIASLAIELAGAKRTRSPGKARGRSLRTPFLGLLTRAEEVGFIGAIGHFELGWLQMAKRPVLCVSLETSRALPGAEIGKGPVVRLGDKFTVFDAGALRVFTRLAQEVLPERHQKQVMDGGTCEGTTAMAYGFPTVGISVPLGNYHNQSFEGGPDSAGPLGPAPEFVHLDDVAGLQELCRALMRPKLEWRAPWDAKLKEFRKDLRGYRSLLR